MNRQQKFKTAFAGTTINGEQVLAVLSKEPNRSPTNHIPKKLEERANWEEDILREDADHCEKLLRLYLCGCATWQGVYQEIDLFLEFEPTSAPALILQALDSIEQLILNNEWYELMRHFIYLKRKVCQRFNL